MTVRRLPPLAVALALVAAALVAAVLTTRRTVIDAYDEVRDGQAFTAEQAVRADLADLGVEPTSEDLATVLRERGGDGLRYIAVVDTHNVIAAEAGTPKGVL